MHKFDVIEVIFDRFMEHMNKIPECMWSDKKSLQCAFYNALDDRIEQLSIRNVINDNVPEECREVYIDNVTNQTAHKIGKSINENPMLVNIDEQVTPIGTEITRTIYLMRVNTLKCKGEKK